jgi:UDP-glucose-4-epimerase GalE
MTILVTGGAGFVGSHFTWAAHEEGRRVIVLDDLSGGSAAPLPPGVRLIKADLGDRGVLRGLFRDEGVDAVVHFAGKIQVGESVRAPGLYFDVNLTRSLSLLEEAREAGISRFIFSSTAAVYGTPTRVPIPETACLAPVNPYGASKLGVEFALRGYAAAHGLRFAALRYFNAAGAHPNGSLVEAHDPETHLIPLVLDAALGRRPPITVFGEDYPTPDGTCVRDYIHVVDLAAAHLAALSALEAGRDVGGVNLGTGRGFSVREVIEAAEGVLKRPVPRAVGPRREGDPAELVADPSLAERLLGWKPARSTIETILEDALRPRLAERD